MKAKSIAAVKENILRGKSYENLKKTRKDLKMIQENIVYTIWSIKLNRIKSISDKYKIHINQFPIFFFFAQICKLII